MMNKFVFTCGDTNGIGPEIVIKLLNKIHNKKNNSYYFICPENVIQQEFTKTKPKFKYNIVNKFNEDYHDVVNIISLKNTRINKGKATKYSGEASFRAIKYSAELLINNKADAVITAPISKNAIHLAGYNFPGHTEMYAEWCGEKKFVMMFLSKKINAALLTIHEPISKIPLLITRKRIVDILTVVERSLKDDLLIDAPRIALLGLNPHAGEEGIIGIEEEKIIKPLLRENKRLKLVAGPFSPDAFFGNQMFKNYDVVIGMYHDQVLIPFKLMNFGKGVNFTAGLPIVRTSPDHGVAYDIAGKGMADESSILEAFYYAEKIVKNRRKNAKKKEN